MTYLISLLLSVFLSLSSIAADSLIPRPSETGVYFLGHTNPDSDSIMSAIGAAHFFGGVPARAGTINAESQYILDKFNLKTPILVDNFKDKKFYLVDFNQSTQLQKGIAPNQIIGIIDHHAIQTSFAGPDIPIPVIIKPWGSTCTIILELFLRDQVEIPENVAGALLGGIVSDTLNLTSPTTTDADRKALEILANITKTKDLAAFTKELFQAKSKTSHLTAEALLQQDFKSFNFNKKKIGIAVIETLFPEDIQKRQMEILNAMTKYKRELQLNYLFLAVVQPESKQSFILILGKEEEKVAKMAFGKDPQQQSIDTSPRVSRKLEFLPAIQKIIQGN